MKTTAKLELTQEKEPLYVRPSELDRAYNCLGYLHFKEELKKLDLLPPYQTSIYAERGTELHRQCEELIAKVKKGEIEYDGDFIYTSDYEQEAVDASLCALEFLEERTENKVHLSLLQTEQTNNRAVLIDQVYSYELKGTCDLVYEPEKGPKIILDFKFGNKPVQSNTLQLVAYAYLSHPTDEGIIVGIIQQNPDKTAFEVKFREYTKDEVYDEIKKIFKAISYTKELCESEYCKYCPCIGHCKLKELPANLSNETAEGLDLEKAAQLLPILERAVTVIKDRLTEHLMAGGEHPTYYITKTTRKNRSFDDYPTLIQKLKDHKLPTHDVKEFTPAGLEKVIGKTLYNKIAEPLTTYTISEIRSLKRKETGEELSLTNKDLLKGMLTDSGE